MECYYKESDQLAAVQTSVAPDELVMGDTLTPALSRHAGEGAGKVLRPARSQTPAFAGFFAKANSSIDAT